MKDETVDIELALQLLHDESRTLTKAIGDIEYDIKHWLPGAETHSDPKRIISFLQGRYEIQRDLLFQLGKVTGHIEEIERERRDDEERRQLKPQTAIPENHLDWLSHIGRWSSNPMRRYRYTRKTTLIGSSQARGKPRRGGRSPI